MGPGKATLAAHDCKKEYHTVIMTPSFDMKYFSKSYVSGCVWTTHFYTFSSKVCLGMKLEVLVKFLRD